METLKLWADFHVGQQMYAYDHFDMVERKRYWRPVSKPYLVYTWLRDLIRGMRDARLGGSAATWPSLPPTPPRRATSRGCRPRPQAE